MGQFTQEDQIEAARRTRDDGNSYWRDELCESFYLDGFSCHASCLNPGIRTHPPHRHDHEELVLLIDGSLDILLGRFGLRSQTLEPGQYVFLPPRRPARRPEKI